MASESFILWFRGHKCYSVSACKHIQTVIKVIDDRNDW